jgi:hypothetical protein
MTIIRWIDKVYDDAGVYARASFTSMCDDGVKYHQSFSIETCRWLHSSQQQG